MKTVKEALHTDLINRIKVLETAQINNIKTIDMTVTNFNKRLSRFQEKVKTYDPENMLEMEKRHNILSNMFQILIEKITVITEVSYHIRHQHDLSAEQISTILLAVIRALDYNDTWWIKGKNLSVKQWAKRCLDPYTELVSMLPDEEEVEKEAEYI